MNERTLKELLAELDELETEKPSRIRRSMKRNAKMLIGISVILVVAGVVAAVALFSHTVPPFSPSVVLTSLCADGTLTAASSSSTNGWVQFNCGGSTSALVASTGTATATLTSFAASGYDAFYIIRGGTPTTSCTTGPTNSVRLDPGPIAITFGGTNPVGDWNYCASFSDVDPKASFTVSWSQ